MQSILLRGLGLAAPAALFLSIAFASENRVLKAPPRIDEAHRRADELRSPYHGDVERKTAYSPICTDGRPVAWRRAKLVHDVWIRVGQVRNDQR